MMPGSFETTTPAELDGVPELPTADDIAGTLEYRIAHNHPHDPQSLDQSGSPYKLTRRDSTASHVAIDHFDPEGVLELRRSLSRPAHPVPIRNGNNSFETGETTLASVDLFSDEKFSLENVLKYGVKK